MKRGMALVAVGIATGLATVSAIGAITLAQTVTVPPGGTQIPVVATTATQAPPIQVQPLSLLPLPKVPRFPSAIRTPGTDRANAPATGKRSSSPTSGQPDKQVSRDSATATVAAATPGRVMGAQRVLHQGLSAWAITVYRADNSTIIGYVDTASGVIYDWRVSVPPPPASNSPRQDAKGASDGHNRDDEQRAGEDEEDPGVSQEADEPDEERGEGDHDNDDD